MLEFRQTMDSHAMDVVRPCTGLGDSRGYGPVGSIQWHPSKQKRLVLLNGMIDFTLSELRELVTELEKKND